MDNNHILWESYARSSFSKFWGGYVVVYFGPLLLAGNARTQNPTSQAKSSQASFGGVRDPSSTGYLGLLVVQMQKKKQKLL